MNIRFFFIYLFGLVLALGVLFFPYFMFDKQPLRDKNSLRVMTYSSFIQKWGAGPEIARRFKEETGLDIQWINAGNAGLLIERLKFKRESDQPDMVVGLDQFSINEARRFFEWHDVHLINDEIEESLLPEGGHFFDFVAYDWGPLTFIYKEGEVDPPHSLLDLLEPKYRDHLILQDPRMSSPGLQFLLWVVVTLGQEKAFDYLEKLKPSIKVMSPSWSSSYSIFKLQQPTLVFSYFASPFFHQIEENDTSYKASRFSEPHPVQVEYAGVPKFCQNCDGAKKFARFLLRTDIQKILMTKNYMFPVDAQALVGSPFKVPKDVKYLKPIESLSLIKKKRDLVNLWKKAFY